MIDHLDHLVLTTIDPVAAEDFYVRVMGMQVQTFAGGRKAFAFGQQKINLHVRGHEFEPKAHLPVPGALDLCFIAKIALDEVIAHLARVQWPIIEGPVVRTGATGPIRSVYVRDPDLNLIEISEPVQPEQSAMKVVFLDSDSLPVSLARPTWVSQWQDLGYTAPHKVVAAARDADIVITNKVAIGRIELAQLPRLRFICVAATGYDCIDLAACRDYAVTVCNVPAYSAQSVAESVIASIFALRRQLFSYQQAARQQWAGSPHFCVHRGPIQDVRGSVLGIIGKGGIGLATARLASSLGMQLMFAEHRGVIPVRNGYQALETVLARSDIITLHCPLTENTRHLIGARELAQMKNGALLINTARGPLVDEAAVLDALGSGRLGGAALDVLCQEPPAADHPLLTGQYANLIVTPHVAWASQSSLQRLAEGVLGNLHGYHQGALANVVS